MSELRGTYTVYSIGCAGVWGAILVLGRRRLDAPTWRALRLVCGGWWVGWTSATVARAGFPPPKPLTPAGVTMLRNVSMALVALGLADVVRLFVSGKRVAAMLPADRARPSRPFIG